MRLRPDSDRECGSATAEFAVVVPSVLVVCALTVGAGLATAQQIRVVDASAVAARAAGRGEGTNIVSGMLAGLTVEAVSVAEDKGLVCVAVDASTPVIGALSVPLHARSCAAVDGG